MSANSSGTRSSHGTSSWRPDIDGLRALAVLAVVIYHIEPKLLPGGYIGVDIFFVISGYLITGILFRQTQAGSFSLWQFYERRVRRILPAATVMMAATLCAGYFVLLPRAYVDLAQSAIAAALSAANVFFYWTTDYFDAAKGTKPLLHTWSLAVEEQFYLVLPIVLLGLSRFGPRVLRTSLIVLALLSFGASCYFVTVDQPAAFYMPYLRAWELLAGGLLAVFRWVPPRSLAMRNVMAFLGLGLIFGSLVLLNEQSSFPGLTAAPACIGAVLLLAAASADPARGSLISWGFSLPPVRYVGLISYSTYLWHWPVIAFYREGSAFLPIELPGGKASALLLLIASLVLGALSRHFIEKPFLNSTARSSKVIVGWGVASIAAICVIAGSVVATGGLASRFSDNGQRIAAYADYDDGPVYRNGDCFISSKYDASDYKVDLCLPTKASGRRVLIIGDSHAAHLWWGFSHTLVGANVGQATASGCLPYIKAPASALPRCVELMDYVSQAGMARFNPDVVVVAAKWSPDDDFADLIANLTRLKATGRHIVLVGPMPQYTDALPKLLLASEGKADPAWIQTRRAGWVPRLDLRMEEMAQAAGLDYVSPYRALCHSGVCTTTVKDGVPIQFDTGHVTAEGSKVLARGLIVQDAAAFAP